MKNVESLTVSDYIAIFRRRMWYVIVITILVTSGAVVYALRLTPVYKSETTIAVSGRLLPEDYIQSIDRQTSTDQMDFVRQQLQSRTFLEGIIRELHLADPGPEGFSDGALSGVGKRIEINILTAAAFKLAFTATDRNLAQAVTKRLAERVIQLNGSFRKEKVQTADQFLEEQLRDAANALSAAEQKVLQFRNQAFPGVTSENVTPDNLHELQAQLANGETKLNAAIAQRKSLEQRLQENRQLKIALKAPSPAAAPSTHGAIESAFAAPASPLENQLALKRAELAAASARYTSLHPDVLALQQQVQQLESLVKQSQVARAPAASEVTKENRKETPVLPEFDAVDLVPAEIQLELDQVNRDIPKLERENAALASKISSVQSRLNPLPTVAQGLAENTREYDAAKVRYTYLSDKKLNSEMAARVDSSANNEVFRVIDPANLPQHASGPNRRMFVSMGALAGLILGLGIAFLRDFLDSALHTEDDASAELKLPILASIPVIPDEETSNAGKQVPLRAVQTYGNPEDPGCFSIRQIDSKVRNVLLNPLCFEAEHYRLLQSKLSAMQRDRPLKSILISSARPNEGKTFSACCIAGVLAQEPGKKVLLIDADSRKANATRMLGLANKKLARTFNAVLCGEVEFEESLMRCAELNLSFLPAAITSSNSAKVMSSHQLERLMRQATEAFDWVIVDSPPIMAVADANRMFPYCDGMLFVVHSGKTPMKLITDSIKRVGRDRICGVLMNRVKTVQSSYYYGGNYQGDYPDYPSIKSKKRSPSQLSEVE
jgi:polysaccharide chain length determinant protein (PEP-CTERM system associated)